MKFQFIKRANPGNAQQFHEQDRDNEQHPVAARSRQSQERDAHRDDDDDSVSDRGHEALRRFRKQIRHSLFWAREPAGDLQTDDEAGDDQPNDERCNNMPLHFAG